MPEVTDSETRAWERMRAAILRCQSDPTDKNRREVTRLSRALTRAMEATSERREDAA